MADEIIRFAGNTRRRHSRGMSTPRKLRSSRRSVEEWKYGRSVGDGSLMPTFSDGERKGEIKRDGGGGIGQHI